MCYHHHHHHHRHHHRHRHRHHHHCYNRTTSQQLQKYYSCSLFVWCSVPYLWHIIVCRKSVKYFSFWIIWHTHYTPSYTFSAHTRRIYIAMDLISFFIDYYCFCCCCGSVAVAFFAASFSFSAFTNSFTWNNGTWI